MPVSYTSTRSTSDHSCARPFRIAKGRRERKRDQQVGIETRRATGGVGLQQSHQHCPSFFFSFFCFFSSFSSSFSFSSSLPLPFCFSLLSLLVSQLLFVVRERWTPLLLASFLPVLEGSHKPLRPAHPSASCLPSARLPSRSFLARHISRALALVQAREAWRERSRGSKHQLQTAPPFLSLSFDFVCCSH